MVIADVITQKYQWTTNKNNYYCTVQLSNVLYSYNKQYNHCHPRNSILVAIVTLISCTARWPTLSSSKNGVLTFAFFFKFRRNTSTRCTTTFIVYFTMFSSLHEQWKASVMKGFTFWGRFNTFLYSASIALVAFNGITFKNENNLLNGKLNINHKSILKITI